MKRSPNEAASQPVSQSASKAEALLSVLCRFLLISGKMSEQRKSYKQLASYDWPTAQVAKKKKKEGLLK